MERQEIKEGSVVPKDFVPYHKVPDLLNKFEYYIDIKVINDKVIPAMSRTGLEALACGLKVFNHELRIVERLPDEHYAIYVAKEALQHYES